MLQVVNKFSIPYAKCIPWRFCGAFAQYAKSSDIKNAGFQMSSPIENTHFKSRDFNSDVWASLKQRYLRKIQIANVILFPFAWFRCDTIHIFVFMHVNSIYSLPCMWNLKVKLLTWIKCIMYILLSILAYLGGPTTAGLFEALFGLIFKRVHVDRHVTRASRFIPLHTPGARRL